MLKNNFKKLFPKRPQDCHKGDFGKVFVLAGSQGMLGAGVLCARAALVSGTGIVYWGVPKKSCNIANLATPEVIVKGGDSAKDFLPLALSADSIVIGPGLGTNRNIAKELLLKLRSKRFIAPIILDADGLMAFKNDIPTLKKLHLNLILTPHPGELAALTGKTPIEIQNDRKGSALKFSKAVKCIVALKGRQTIIADKNEEIFINQTGNPGMATAGAGDVLAGIIASIAGRKNSAWDAATAGTYLHGLAGDSAAKTKGEYGMIASDIIENIPYAIHKFH